MFLQDVSSDLQGYSHRGLSDDKKNAQRNEESLKEQPTWVVRLRITHEKSCASHMKSCASRTMKQTREQGISSHVLRKEACTSLMFVP